MARDSAVRSARGKRHELARVQRDRAIEEKDE
jgi:hypothetical protein